MAQITKTIEILACDACLPVMTKAVEKVMLATLGEKPREFDLCGKHMVALQRATGQKRDPRIAPNPTDCPVCSLTSKNNHAQGQHMRAIHGDISRQAAAYRAIIRGATSGGTGHVNETGQQAKRDLDALYDRARREWQEKIQANKSPAVSVSDVTDDVERVHV